MSFTTELGIIHTPRTHKHCPDKLVSHSNFGVEIEVEMVDDLASLVGLREFIKYWKVVPERSLMAPNSAEFVLREPLFGEDLVSALEVAKTHLLPRCGKHSFSPMTSVHVHVDARDMLLEQTLNFLFIYCSFETLLYNFAGQSRRHNEFCLPWVGSHSLNPVLIHSLRKYFESDNHGHKNNSATDLMACFPSKYSGLNLQTMADYGSIEFRHLAGTLDIDRILDWINIIGSIKNFAVEAGEIGNLALVSSSMGPLGYKEEVFGHLSSLLSADDEIGSIYEGMRYAQAIMYYKHQKIQECSVLPDKYTINFKLSGDKAILRDGIYKRTINFSEEIEENIDLAKRFIDNSVLDIRNIFTLTPNKKIRLISEINTSGLPKKQKNTEPKRPKHTDGLDACSLSNDLPNFANQAPDILDDF